MTQEAVRKGEFSFRQALGRMLARSGLAEGVFTLLGAGLSLFAFFALNVFVQGLVSKEYERMTEARVESLSGGLQEIEQSAEVLRAMLSLSDLADKTAVMAKVKSAGVAIEDFDQVAWVYQQEPGKWQFLSVYQKPEGTGAYEIIPDRNLIGFLVQNKAVLETRQRLLAEERFFKSRGEAGSTVFRSRPFAIIKPVRVGDFQTGVIIAVSQPSAALSRQSLQAETDVAQLRVKEQGGGLEMLRFDSAQTQDYGTYSSGQVYEFPFGDMRWEVAVTYYESEKIFFLQIIPYLLLVFGLMMTGMGALYILSNQRLSRSASDMNKILAQKNEALQHEMAERQRLGDTIAASERAHRSILDAVSDIIFEADAAGKILFLNETWRKVTGFDPAQTRGIEVTRLLHPQDQERHQREFELLLKGARESYRSFARLRAADGTFRAVEIAVSLLRDQEGEGGRVVGTITDVEERRRAERALSEAEKKYRTIVENAAGGIYQLTPEGVYLSANPALARLLGYESPEELLRHVKDANREVYFDPRERQNFLRELESIGMLNNFETQVVHRDGRPVWVNESCRVVIDEDGQVLYYEGSLEDISRRKQTEQELRDAKVISDLANRAKSEFLANMSHELRTPLNAIIGFSEMIMREIFGPVGHQSYKDYAADIHDGGKKLLKIINDILDISKIQAGERSLNEAVVDLGALVDICVEMTEPRAAEGRIALVNAVKAPPHLVGEELAIKQIMLNLLSNAIKFTPQGGRVTISCETAAQGGLRLCVTDTGVGLDAQEIEKALSPFGQLNSDLSRKSDGTGLGLTLVDALARLHGGRFELFSEKGIGTTAAIVFPAERVRARETTRQDS